ncbi:urocanate hydratase [Myroides odoratimimus CCUG 12901]|uniref:urocanate hydratase n=1 Tax=Myroides odoratimimus TaxID=76832 RepID=UPI0002460DB5|nr:urocanate hydratase [Myroides odoratimimus]EHO05589.1 urocanate hydratase [Myroides odoratimimus CCUG 12901]MDM1507384.1 urocanate hydratase [Myroides odoratimimus]MDM1510905.1 urocanate hydratase [Myroides odoratimimus]MDM1517629.1 urocanate hydratase [Myroides odoratimimus]MDM1527343.1 urocanate hydratase [Myroides odoratimimus]
MTFQEHILQGIPTVLPPKKEYDLSINHAPKRKEILSDDEKVLALKNALRYFPSENHSTLIPEFKEELEKYGRIYMYRLRPDYKMYARPIGEYPGQCLQAKAIMLMIQNNLDYAVAQHPHELITYGGNGAVFSNWAQYLLTMKYLGEMTDEQTLVMYSGHPMGLFPSHKNAPRVVVTNGMMIPNYSKPDDWEKFNALGVTQYGQMTAGSYMYIGPQGIVHGTTITVLNGGRKIAKNGEGLAGKLFVTSGLGGMSGAQPKAGNIAGCITVCAEVNPKAVHTRHSQGWVDEVITDINALVVRVKKAQENKEIVSIAYQGNVVDIWEEFDKQDLYIDLGSDQTSLHNPWAGGYYPVGVAFEEANDLMANNPAKFKELVQESLRRQAAAINKHTAKGTYFFDYGNAFLLEASRAGADVMAANNIDFRYPSYVQDIMGPMCFDYGFGPFRWVCTSGNPEDLAKTDEIACEVLEEMIKNSPVEIQQQMADNIRWIKGAQENKLVVGSQARILYADAEGRINIARAFNDAIKAGKIGPVVLGRDHHDVSGTDSPYRETSNIYDGSKFTADMAIHNVIGDSFRGATWVSIHNGGGVGWGEVINGGFGMLLDGTIEAQKRLESMLFWDVNNGIARRSWARNDEAIFAIKRAMEVEPLLKVTIPNIVDENLLK